jgi:hypothetical protein
VSLNLKAREASDSSFFSSVRSYFKGEYSGRYLSAILKELARFEPKVFARIFRLSAAERKAVQNGDLQVVREWYVSRTGRKADLAVLQGGVPRLLIEVKEDDVASTHNAEQLRDYRRAVESDPDLPLQPTFAHVSRFVVPENDKRLLQEFRRGQLIEVRYRDIHRELTRADGPVAMMFRDYLEDIGVASYRMLPNDDRHLAFLLAQMFGFPHQHGLGKLYSAAAIRTAPEIIATLIGNTEVFGDWIQEANQSICRRAFLQKFFPEPQYDLGSVRRALKEAGNETTELPGGHERHIRSGILRFFTQGKLGSPPSAAAKDRLGPDDWLHVRAGYAIDIAINSSKDLCGMRMFATLFGKSLDECTSETPYLNAFPAEAKALKLLHQCLSRARARALRTATGATKISIEELKLPPLP